MKIKRSEAIRMAIAKAKKAIEKMNASIDIAYTEERIQVTTNVHILVECDRYEYEFYTDEQGEEHYIEDYGKAMGFTVYLVKNGKEIDQVTKSTGVDLETDLKYLLNCWI